LLRYNLESTMNIGIIITIIAFGILFFIIFQLTVVKKKLQFEIDKKDQELNAEIEENRFQKYFEREQKELGKNKWLYSTDNFGEMEKGSVLKKNEF